MGKQAKLKAVRKALRQHLRDNPDSYTEVPSARLEAMVDDCKKRKYPIRMAVVFAGVEEE